MAGQSQVFKDGEALFLKMMGIKASGMQIQRVSENYDEHIEADHHRFIEREKTPPLVADKKKDTVYVMVDGSMLFTREEGWKEDVYLPRRIVCNYMKNEMKLYKANIFVI